MVLCSSKLDYSEVLLMRCFMCIELAYTVLHYCDHSAHTQYMYYIIES